MNWKQGLFLWWVVGLILTIVLIYKIKDIAKALGHDPEEGSSEDRLVVSTFETLREHLDAFQPQAWLAVGLMAFIIPAYALYDIAAKLLSFLPSLGED